MNGGLAALDHPVHDLKGPQAPTGARWLERAPCRGSERSLGARAEGPLGLDARPTPEDLQAPFAHAHFAELRHLLGAATATPNRYLTSH